MSSLFIVLKIRERFTVERRQVQRKFVRSKEARMSGLIRGGDDGSLPTIDPKSQGEHLDLVAKCGGDIKSSGKVMF